MIESKHLVLLSRIVWL